MNWVKATYKTITFVVGYLALIVREGEKGVGGGWGISRKILETVQAAQQKPEWLVTKWEFAFPQLLNEKEKHKLSKKLEQKILTKELND